MATRTLEEQRRRGASVGEQWKVRVLAGPRLERGESEVTLPITAVSPR